MYTLETPSPLESLPMLNVSSAYFIEITANTPTSADYNNIMEFAVNTIDRGKKHIRNPSFKAFVVDSLGNIRGIFPDTSQNNSYNMLVNKKFKLLFQPSPSDQKVIGTWKLYIFLFDRDNGALASYSVYEFEVTDKKGNSFFLAVAVASIAALIVEIFAIIFRGRFHKKIMRFLRKTEEY